MWAEAIVVGVPCQNRAAGRTRLSFLGPSRWAATLIAALSSMHVRLRSARSLTEAKRYSSDGYHSSTARTFSVSSSIPMYILRRMRLWGRHAYWHSTRLHLWALMPVLSMRRFSGPLEQQKGRVTPSVTDVDMRCLNPAHSDPARPIATGSGPTRLPCEAAYQIGPSTSDKSEWRHH